MSTATVIDPLKRALTQSEALLALAKADDWESFELLVQNRQQGLLVLQTPEFLHDVAELNAADEVARLIQAIQAINRELEDLSLKHQDGVASEIRHMAKSSKAMSAYGQ
jgi:flagellar protein FliT